MKLATRKPRRLGRKTKNGVSRTRARQPSFADAVKRLSGIMEGAPDLSSREGFGPRISR